MSDEPVRLDKWLWAARFYKTRALAADAVDGGKVHLNGDRVKRSKNVKLGDSVTVRNGAFEHIVIVRDLSERRGPASVAALLYEETEASRATRERLVEQHRLAATVTHDHGRPTKRDRRSLDDLRGR